jgi:hypothetical protein
MARTNIVPTQISRAGVSLPAETVGTADGCMFANDGNCWIEVRNANVTTPYSVTVVTTATVDSKAVADDVVSIPSLGTKALGPYPMDIYNLQSGADAGKVYVNFEAGHESDFNVRVLKF